MQKFICCIDGNIGAGKSTLLDELQKRGYYVFQEDLGNWGGYLDLFYKDPERWAFTLQIVILKSMIVAYKQIMDTPSHVVFTERSPLSSLVFSRNGNRMGFLSDLELELVEEFYKTFAWSPSINIFLDVEIPTCFKRMKQRGRECEQHLEMSYLERLHEEYKKLDCTIIEASSTPATTADAVESLLIDMGIITNTPPPSR